MHVYSTRRVYEGNVINLRVDEVDARKGGRRAFEVVEHKGGVVIVAQPAPGTIVLVRQQRHAVGEDLWEVPAGMLETGEDPAHAAARELREETGYRAERVRYLWSAYSTPGFCTELLRFFVAEALTPGEPSPDDNEEFEVRTFPSRTPGRWSSATSCATRSRRSRWPGRRATGRPASPRRRAREARGRPGAREPDRAHDDERVDEPGDRPDQSVVAGEVEARGEGDRRGRGDDLTERAHRRFSVSTRSRGVRSSASACEPACRRARRR